MHSHIISDKTMSCSSDELLLQSVTGRNIHLREKNIAGPTERSKMRKHF